MIDRRAVAAAAVTGVQVGAAMVATRFVVDQAGPASLALLRYMIGFGCLVPFLWWSGERLRSSDRERPPRSEHRDTDAHAGEVRTQPLDG